MLGAAGPVVGEGWAWMSRQTAGPAYLPPISPSASAQCSPFRRRPRTYLRTSSMSNASTLSSPMSAASSSGMSRAGGYVAVVDHLQPGEPRAVAFGAEVTHIGYAVAPAPVGPADVREGELDAR